MKPFSLRNPALVVSVLVLLLGAVLTELVYRAEQSTRELEFLRVADEVSERLDVRLAQHIALLTATRSWFVAAGTLPNRQEFATYAEGVELLDTYAGIQGIGFAMLTQTDDPAMVVSWLNEYFVGVDIRPATDQARRTPIILLEPLSERNMNAIGYDMYSEEVRRTAMVAAEAAGEARASGPVELVQEITTTKQSGFLIYVHTLIEPNPLRDGSDPIDGYVYAPFRIGDLVNAALADGQALPIELSIVDAAVPDWTIYQSDGFGAGTRRTIVELAVAGRLWLLEVEARPGFASRRPGMGSAFVALLSVLLAATAGSVAAGQVRQLRNAETSAQIAQEKAAEREFLLGEMKHRIKNHIARIQAIARQTTRDAADLQTFGKLFGDRLNAMAAAQDLLVQGGTDGARIGDVIAQELRQSFATDQIDQILSGPDVFLNERQSHGLSLVVHELTTNGIKHGKLSEGAENLSVRWERSQNDLRVIWREAGGAPSETVKPGSGFGTKLLDVCIRGELKGTLQRSTDAEGLTIEITFPLENEKRG